MKKVLKGAKDGDKDGTTMGTSLGKNPGKKSHQEMNVLEIGGLTLLIFIYWTFKNILGIDIYLVKGRELLEKCVCFFAIFRETFWVSMLLHFRGVYCNVKL